MKKTYPDNVVVDEHDNVIGQMQLPDAFEQGRILRVARVMVVNSNQEILLQQRGKYVYSPLLWNDAAAGHVDVGDDYIDTAVRELAEETGLQARSEDLKKIDYFFLEEGKEGRKTPRFHTVYVYSYDGDVVVQDDEVEAFRWISPEDLINEIKNKPENFTGGFRVLAENYLKSAGAR